MEVVGSVNQAGAVDVLYGSPDGLSESAAQFLHQDGADLHESSEAGDRFGPAVANGDFDGDGFADLAIGSPGEDLKTLGAGAVAILYGGPAGVGTRRDRTIHEPSSAQRHGDHFGAALATGDLDGDGFADLAIGTPDARAAGASSAGSVTSCTGHPRVCDPPPRTCGPRRTGPVILHPTKSTCGISGQRSSATPRGLASGSARRTSTSAPTATAPEFPTSTSPRGKRCATARTTFQVEDKDESGRKVRRSLEAHDKHTFDTRTSSDPSRASALARCARSRARLAGRSAAGR